MKSKGETQKSTEKHRTPRSATSPWFSVILCGPLCLWLFALLPFAIASCSSQGPSPPKTPQEELATIEVEPGLKVELIASEPMVEDPVFITFDENGKLWVVEMRGFMPDVDGTGEDQRIGRISILQDTTGDGVMDNSTIYLDSLIMPRALAVIRGGALLVEDQKLWLTKDDDRDLVADSKTLIDAEYGGPPMPEHSPNGLWRGIDNWYYNAKSAFRYREVNGQWIKDSTEFRGQWGMSHDDEGRLFYNYNWSQLHADLVPPNYLSRNPHHKPTTGIDHGVTLDRKVYPIRSNPAVNRGYIPGTLDEQGRLLEFTAACSPFVYRGTALPPEYYGNAFVAEPSGNLVKRNVVVERGVNLSAFDPHPGTEFMASTDERFRPVSITSGPDGALYVADMYRGLVQHHLYVTPYLREQTLQRKLVLPLHYGRIWRVVPEDWKHPIIDDQYVSTALIDSLGSANGWTRDIAQRLLVDLHDESMADLIASSMHSGNSLKRLHSLWAIEGMGHLTAGLLFNYINDESDAVANSALRMLEPLAADPAVRKRLSDITLAIHKPANYKRKLQYVLASTALNPPVRMTLIENILTEHVDSALMRDAVMSAITDEEFKLLQRLSDKWREPNPGREIFVEIISSAIVGKRNGDEVAKLLEMSAGTTWLSGPILTGVITSGSLKSPVSLRSEPAIMSRADSASATQLAQMFEWPGHKVDSTQTVARLLNDRELEGFADGRKLYLTSCASCHGSNGAGMNRLAPTLVGSEWVLGDERRLALLVLHGLEGPLEVKGKMYDVPEILPVMPSHSTMDDGAITSILIYIRNEWGNQAGPVNPRTVGRTRHTTQGRVVPWTAKELNEHMKDTLAAGDE